MLRYLKFYSGILVLLLPISFCIAQDVAPGDRWEIRLNNLQPGNEIMDAVGVKEGMVIGEIGAGRGRFTVQFAQKVRKSGKVFANDINENNLRYLDFRCKRDNIANVITVLGTEVKTNLPEEFLDMVFIINTFHHIDQKESILKNISASLKKNAILVIIEPDPEKPEGNNGTNREVLVDIVQESGYDLVEIKTFLKRDNIYIFKL